MLDPEHLYRLLLERRWADLAAEVYRHRADLPEVPTALRAVELFAGAFLDAVDAEGATAHADVLEKLFLLHTGGFYRLEAESFARVVVHLVRRHAGDPVAAAAYARHCPEVPVCADALRPFTSAPSAAYPDIDVAHAPPAATTALRLLFRSRQERAFFDAVRAVFPAALVYPNVALRTVVDLDALRPLLTPHERRYATVALLDCTVFDPADGRPRAAFELDSDLHDDPDRQRRDRYKDRVCHLAGLSLYRLRPRGAGPDAATFEALLRALPLEDA